MNLNFINKERLIHSLKTVIACIIGIFITHFIGPTGGQWIIITIIVVMCAQIYVGSVLQKAYFRFLGTLAGCLFAATTLELIGHNAIASVFAISISSFIFSYFATGLESLAYTGTLGAATTAIIMLGQSPSLYFAFERFFEITLGILIASCVSQFILPIHARTHLRNSQAETLTQLCDYYQSLLRDKKALTDEETNELDEKIVKSLLRQRQLAKESARERLGKIFNPLLFANNLYYERGILRSIKFMHYSLIKDAKLKHAFENNPEAKLFNDDVIQGLEILSKTLKLNLPLESHIHIPKLVDLKNALLKEQDFTSNVDMTYFYGFFFSAEILTTNLVKLAELYHVPIHEK